MLKASMAVLTTLSAVVLFSAGNLQAEEKKWEKIVIATEGAFPPYNLTRPDGTLDGYEIEIGNYLCAEMKIECEFVAQNFEGIIPALNAGKFDAIMAGMSATDKRKEVINFSSSYGSTGQAFASYKNSDLVNLPMKSQLFSLGFNEQAALEALNNIKPQLQGKTVGVQTASMAARFVKEYLDGVVTVREYKTTEQHDLDLMSERVDFVMASMGYLTIAKDKPSNSEMVIVGPRFQGGFLGAGSSVGLRKTDTELKAKFDAAILKAKETGKIKELSEKWFGYDLTPH